MSALIKVGVLCMAIPVVGLMILMMATGHTIKGKAEEGIFGAAYGAFWLGRFLVPIGIICFIIAAVSARK